MYFFKFIFCKGIFKLLELVFYPLSISTPKFGKLGYKQRTIGFDYSGFRIRTKYIVLLTMAVVVSRAYLIKSVSGGRGN